MFEILLFLFVLIIYLQVVDTPGFGDSDGSDNQLIEEMMDVLDDKLGYTNIIVLTLDGATPRFTTGLQNMLRQMSSIFGDTWWDFMMVGVTKWPYDQGSIDERREMCDMYGDPSDNCKNEDWLIRELTDQLVDKFNISQTLPFAFLDSFSQSGSNLDDQTQQEHWIRETETLWHEATGNGETFSFQDINDAYKEIERLRRKNKRLKKSNERYKQEFKEDTILLVIAFIMLIIAVILLSPSWVHLKMKECSRFK